MIQYQKKQRKKERKKEKKKELNVINKEGKREMKK